VPAERIAEAYDPRRNSRVRVLLADDDCGYRNELVEAIRSNLELELVGQVSDGTAALEMIQLLDPDVAVVDLRMPGIDGIEVCTRACGAGSRTRVVVLTGYVDGALVGRARRAGACGYLGKETSLFDICDAVSRVSGGGTAFARTG
jgi:DNA-binding NarL/FixJ family response regulator